MRSILLPLVAALLSAQAPPAELQQFDEAIAASDFRTAAAAINKLIEQRTPKDGQPRQDPVLNSLLGRLMLAANAPSAAVSYLSQTKLADLSPSVRTKTALAFGRAMEIRGDRAGALQAYRDAAAAGASDIERRQAALGIARQLLVTEPSAVRDQLIGIASGAAAADRWEARYLMSLANSLLGDSVSAARFADEAWADATSAPPTALAPVHVATLKAGLAAARRDLTAERAMLAATNGLKLHVSGSLSGQLPVCGDDGVVPSDFVIFGIVAGPYGNRDLIPIAASRLAAVAPFHKRMAGFQLIREAGRAPVGTVITVSCRTSVSSTFIAERFDTDPLLDWFVERGLYPASATHEVEDANINAIAARIDSLEARFGKQSIQLIEPRLQLANLLQKRALAGDPVSPGQLTDLLRDVAEGLRRAGAPSWIAQSIDNDANTKPAGSTQIEAYLRVQLANAPFHVARTFITHALAKLSNEDLSAAASRLVLALHERSSNVLSGREREAWLLTVAEAQRSLGKDREARATLASAGLHRGACVFADEPPKLLEQHFSYSDYPNPLLMGEQEGAVYFEFGVTSMGSITNPRIVYSMPSGLFDEASAQGIASVRYTRPMWGGKPASCRGAYQPVIWRLEEETDIWTPSLTPQVPMETT